MTEIVRIPFHGNEVQAVDIDGKPYPIFRPLVESIGLDYSTQIMKLKTRSWANRRDIPTVAADGKTRVMVAIDVPTLMMWLATINETKVAPEVRDLLIAYQRESVDAIYGYWTRGSATNPRTQAEPRQSISDAELMALIAETEIRRQLEAIAAAKAEIEDQVTAAQRDLAVISAMGSNVNPTFREALVRQVWATYSSTVGPDSRRENGPTVLDLRGDKPHAGTGLRRAQPHARSMPRHYPEDDMIRQWISDACEPYAWGTQAAILHAAFADWCQAQRIPHSRRPTMVKVGRRLTALGYPARRRVGLNYRPLQLRDQRIGIMPF